MSRWNVAGYPVRVSAVRGARLLDGEVQGVRWLHVAMGHVLAARVVGISGPTFSRVVRGLRVSARTVAKVRKALCGRVVHVHGVLQ